MADPETAPVLQAALAAVRLAVMSPVLLVQLTKGMVAVPDIHLRLMELVVVAVARQVAAVTAHQTMQVMAVLD